MNGTVSVLVSGLNCKELPMIMPFAAEFTVTSGFTAPEIALKLGIVRSVVYEDRTRLLELIKAEAAEAANAAGKTAP